MQLMGLSIKRRSTSTFVLLRTLRYPTGPAHSKSVTDRALESAVGSKALRENYRENQATPKWPYYLHVLQRTLG